MPMGAVDNRRQRAENWSMPVSEATYERVALEDLEGHWELVCGRLRRKPDMTMEHKSVASRLAFLLQSQLELDAFEVHVNGARARRSPGNAFIPDVVVIPASLMAALAGTGRLEAYEAPLPFVAEVWSPSTGEYDVEEKFPETAAAATARSGESTPTSAR